MIIKKVKKDLFTMPDDYALAHCISADFALGAGIAKKFRNGGVYYKGQRFRYYN